MTGSRYRYAVQGTLALDLRGGQPGLPETPELDPTRQSRVPAVDEPEVRAWAARFAQAVVETLGGQRTGQPARAMDRPRRAPGPAASRSPGRQAARGTRSPIRPQVAQCPHLPAGARLRRGECPRPARSTVAGPRDASRATRRPLDVHRAPDLLSRRIRIRGWGVRAAQGGGAKAWWATSSDDNAAMCVPRPGPQPTLDTWPVGPPGAPWQRLYFLPDPHGHRLLRPTSRTGRRSWAAGSIGAASGSPVSEGAE